MRQGSIVSANRAWEWLLPVGIGLVLCAVTLAVWHGQVEARRTLQGQRTLDVSAQAARRLEVFVDSHLRVAEVFARRWVADEDRDYSRERFDNFTKALMDTYSGFHRVLLQPASGGPAWAATGAEALGELLARPDHQQVLDRAQERGGPAISAPFMGPNGENKFFAALPLRKAEELLGFLMVVFRAETLIDDCFHTRIRSEFHFLVSDREQVLYRSSPGATDAWLASSPTHATARIPIGQRTWELTMAPRPELSAAIGWGADLSVPGLGFGLSAGMALLAWLLLRRMRQVHAAHASTLGEMAERQRAEAARERAMVKLAQLSRQVIRAQEDERGRLSRELHDELGQLLTALRLELGWLEKAVSTSGPQAREALTSLTSMVEEATRQLRRLCRGLRPPLLDDLGLEPAVRQLVDEFQAQTDVEVDLDLRLDGGLEQIPDEQALCAYRILQEALTNVRRHAKADRVSIRAHVLDQVLEFEVRDDGRGFTPESVADSTHCGLEGMRERAKLVDGEIEITSRPGAGCRVALQIPISLSPKETSP